MPSPKPLALIATLRLNTPDRPKVSARQPNPQQNYDLRECKGDEQRPNRKCRVYVSEQLPHSIILFYRGLRLISNCLESLDEFIVSLNCGLDRIVVRRSKTDRLQQHLAQVSH